MKRKPQEMFSRLSRIADDADQVKRSKSAQTAFRWIIKRLEDVVTRGSQPRPRPLPGLVTRDEPIAPNPGRRFEVVSKERLLDLEYKHAHLLEEVQAALKMFRELVSKPKRGEGGAVNKNHCNPPDSDAP